MWVCLCVSVLEMESTQAGLLTLRDRETLVVNLEEDDNETVVWLGEGGGRGISTPELTPLWAGGKEYSKQVLKSTLPRRF